jgi:hypothetical protein
VTRRVHALAAGQFRFGYLKKHIILRMQERGIDEVDVRNVLKTGSMIEKHCPGGRWRYTMQGRITEGSQIKIVVAVDEECSHITLVTVMRMTKKGEWR